MHAMGRKKGDRSYNSTDTTGDSSDDADLILSESSSGRTKKYVVSTDESQSLCTKKLSRNERLCLIIGGIVLAVVVLVFIIVAVAVNRKTGSTTGDEPWKNVRLPTNIVPSEYEVNLRVNLENFDVIGEVTVCAEVTAETSYILIHVKDMNVTVVQVSQGGSAVMIKSEFNFTENDFYVIELSTRLQTGPLEIRMTYNYTLRDDLVGFYRSSYVQSTGEKRWIATTQFEPTDARRAFPCFDEPGLKANFTIQITHDAQYKQVVSNMPVESSVPSSSDSNMVTTRFKTSVKMSTYLVAFIVSDFECVNGSTESGVMVRVCSNPEVINKTHYALEVATTVLGFYETFYGVPYPLEKQDLFAIPDFAAGAMENWGLITYRETALLYDSETNPASSRQRVAVVIAHELAHQWFGNLVTMAWWDGLWLNEGFATFVEYIGTNEAEPDFHMLDQFYTSDLSEALAEDGLNESHPIIQNVSDPDEINSLFDSISYSKGSSVIRMLQSYLTNTVFHNGIKLYLDTHKFANADTNQLWEALQEKVVPPKDYTVSEIMDTWTKQMGYPVVTFSKTANTLTQTRFFVNGKPDVIASSPFNYIWIIPFDYTTDQSSSGEIVDSIVLSDNQTGLEWPATAEWVKADVGETGVYRVNYDTENWRALTQHLMDNPDSTLLPPVDRAGLLDDAFALSSAGLLDTVMALRLSWYLRNEREYVPWRAAINWIFTFAERLSLTPLFGNYQRFVLNLTRSAVNEFGFDRQNLTHLQTFLRTNLLATAWQFGHLEVISTARALFQEWRENGTIDPNLKDVVYQVGVAYGSEEDWDYMWEWYSTTDDPYEKRLCLRALAQSREPWILSRYLNYSVTKVRTQDTLTVVELVSENVIGRYLAWNFVRNNWHYFNEVYGGGSFSFSRLIRTITSAFSTELELKEVETFFGELPDLRSGTRATRQAIETIRGNVAWLEANLSLLDKCLENTEQCFT